MYTGIVQANAVVLSVVQQRGARRLKLYSDTPIFDDAQSGASVAIDGTCLTLVENQRGKVDFDISDRTATITTLKSLQQGTVVNVERSHRLSQENGGHNLFGHIDGVAEIVDWAIEGSTVKSLIRVPEKATPYLFPKGFIGLQGCSLTIDEVHEEKNFIRVNLVPETLRLTTFKSMGPGHYVNYEIDQTTRSIVDTIRRALTIVYRSPDLKK